MVAFGVYESKECNASPDADTEAISTVQFIDEFYHE